MKQIKIFTISFLLLFYTSLFAQQNLVVNSGFETSASTYNYWSALNGSSSVSISTTNFYTGTKSLSVAPASTTANFNIQLATAALATNNTSLTYTVSAYAMVPATQADSGNIQFEFRDMLTGGSISYSGNIAVPNNGVWTKLSWTLPSGKPSSIISRLVLDLGYDGNAVTHNGNMQMYIDDIKLSAPLSQVLNIFPNPSFELLSATAGLSVGTVFSNITAYNTSGSTITNTTTPGTFVDGSNALSVVSSTGTTNYIPQILNSNSSPLSTIAGYQYKWTFKVATPSTSPAGNISVTIQDAAGTASTVYLASQATPNDGVFRVYTGFFNAPSTQSLMFFNLGAVASATYYIDSVSIVPTTAVPIKLLSFSAQKKGQQVDLFWSTGSEINNDYFEIERSFDNNLYQTIGKVNSKSGGATSQSILQYTYADPINFNGVAYYKLKQVDKDGNISYSPIVKLNVSKQKMEASVWPNPISKNSTLSFNSSTGEGQVRVIITSLDGKTVANKTYNTTAGTNAIQLEGLANSFLAGTYQLSIYRLADNELIANTKFLKL